MTYDEFSIDYSWEPRDTEDRFGDMSGWPVVMQGLHAFLAKNSGWFRIKAGVNDATFALMPDLSTIFTDLATILSTLEQREGVSTELDMFEQGTDVGIFLRRSGDAIVMQFETAPGSGKAYQMLIDAEITVSAQRFFQQWRQFLLAILDAIIDCMPGVSEEKDFAAYREAIDGMARTNA